LHSLAGVVLIGRAGLFPSFILDHDHFLGVVHARYVFVLSRDLIQQGRTFRIALYSASGYARTKNPLNVFRPSNLALNLRSR
jgi:hypothetical protein